MSTSVIWKGPGVAGEKRLLVFTRSPERPSFRQRIAPYLEPLAQRGVVAEVAELSRSPLSRRRQLLAARQFQGVLIQKKTLTLWDAAFLRRGGRRLIYDFDDAIIYKARAADRGPDPKRLGRFRRTVAMADLVIAGNAALAEHARQAAAARVVIVPTGLDTARYGPPAQRPTDAPLRLVWIGSRSTLKQLQPFHTTLTAIARAVPGVVLRVIADAPLALADVTVANVPWARETEARLLGESDIGIAPLPDTPFTRGKCGFKVLQYMATGLPVITSPVGVNADLVAHEHTGLWAGSTDQWVEAVCRLASDAALRRRMGLAGRQRAAQFDFSVLAPRVCDPVVQVLG